MITIHYAWHDGSIPSWGPKLPVAVELSGGLANQLFQFAAGYSLARRLGRDLVLDHRRELLFSGNQSPLREIVATQPEVISSTGTRLLHLTGKFSHGMRIRLARKRKISSPFDLPVWRPEAFSFDNAFFEIDSPVWLRGHFQSDRYFSDVADEVRRKVNSRQPSVEAPVGPWVALHVRRGDYLKKANRSRHAPLPIEYYLSALEIARERIPDVSVIAYSDDYDWTLKHLGQHVQDVMRPSRYASGDLLTMGRADGHIIANSTYSWWAAWLANSRLVIGPKRWFGDETLESQSICPEDWILV